MDQNLTSPPPKNSGFSDQGVVDQVRMDQGQEPEKDTWEILKADFLRNGHSLEDADEYYDYLEEGILNNTIRILRNGNSLLEVELIAPGQASVDLFHDTTPKNIINDSVEFTKALKAAGFNYIKLYAVPERVGKLAKIVSDATGYKYTVTPQPDGEYLIEWRL